MSFLSKLLGRSKPQSVTSNASEALIPVPIPALSALLLNLEKQKGAPLTQEEVIGARDKAVCMMLPLSMKTQMDEERGYRDIDPENVWEEWLAFKAQTPHGSES